MTSGFTAKSFAVVALISFDDTYIIAFLSLSCSTNRLQLRVCVALSMAHACVKLQQIMMVRDGVIAANESCQCGHQRARARCCAPQHKCARPTVVSLPPLSAPPSPSNMTPLFNTH